MSLFIHKENQEVLWNLLNKTPQFKNTFKHSHPQASQQWFRSTIEKYYYEKNIEKQPIDRTNLIIINKNALSYMMQQLIQPLPTQNTPHPHHTHPHPHHPQQPHSPPPYSPMPQQPRPPSMVSPTNQSQVPSNLFMETTYSRMDSKENTYTSQYEIRQKEYENMFAKPVPQVDPKLNDNIKDEAITNMEELIEQHRRQREEELRMVQPPPLLPVPSVSPVVNTPVMPSMPSMPITPTNMSIQNHTKLQIQETTQLEPNIIYEIKESISQNSKNVSWKDEIVQQNLEEEFRKLKLQVEMLQSKVFEIETIGKRDNILMKKKDETEEEKEL